MDLSVIIPSLGEWSRLKLSLAALGRQTISSDVKWEVLVVLDGVTSVPGYDFPAQSYSLRQVCLPTRRGRGGARNAGVFLAKGESVVFLDDDVLVGANFVAGHFKQQLELQSLCHGPLRELPALAWVEDGDRGTPDRTGVYVSRRMREWTARVVSDLDDVELCYEKHGRRSRLEQEGMKAFSQGRKAIAWVAFAGANLSAPRKWILEDGFDERPGTRWGLEDLSLALRWSLKGRPLTVAPDSWGLHLTHPRPAWRENQRENLCCLDFISSQEALSVLKYLEGEASADDLEAALLTAAT